MLETEGWGDYALIDSGHGRKLERYGGLSHHPARGAGAVDAAPSPAAEWERADATSSASTRTRRTAAGATKPLGETWPMRAMTASFPRPLHRLPPCRRLPRAGDALGVDEGPDRRRRPAAEGAQPLRLYRRRLAGRGAGRRRGHPCRRLEEGDRLGAREPDARRTDDLPIRWICEERPSSSSARCGAAAATTASSSIRRNSAAGRTARSGTSSSDLPKMMRACRELLADDALLPDPHGLFDPRLVPCRSTSCAPRRCGRRRVLESGELVLREEGGGRALSTSLFSRWSRE